MGPFSAKEDYLGFIELLVDAAEIFSTCGLRFIVCCQTTFQASPCLVFIKTQFNRRLLFSCVFFQVPSFETFHYFHFHPFTLTTVFSEPVPRNLEWKRVESLLLAAGC